MDDYENFPKKKKLSNLLPLAFSIKSFYLVIYHIIEVNIYFIKIHFNYGGC